MAALKIPAALNCGSFPSPYFEMIIGLPLVPEPLN